MRNTLLKYDKISSKKFVAEDYTSKKFRKILEVPELSDSMYIDYIELIDNQTIEQISYILYGTPDYWDLLVLINDRDPLFDMSYEFDIQEEIAEARVQKYLQGYSGIYKADTYDRMKEYALTNMHDINEENRTMKIIRPERLTHIVKIIDDLEV